MRMVRLNAKGGTEEGENELCFSLLNFTPERCGDGNRPREIFAVAVGFVPGSFALGC